MRIIRSNAPCPPDARGAAIALGNFDGLHMGHRKVIGQAVEAARSERIPAAVMTFEPHPRRFFTPSHAPIRIMRLRTKLRLLEEMGVDILFLMRFDAAFSRIPAESFVQDILQKKYAVRHVVVGHDFIFGHKRGGNAETLYRMAEGCGFDFTQVTTVREEGAICSSTHVRELLAKGDVAGAARMLGHAYEVEGHVQHGDKRGRELGIPTANLAMGDMFPPAYGIYAVRASVADGAWQDGAASFGVRPTFGTNAPLLEVHLFDFGESIYGRRLRVRFVEWIREERAFADVAALKDAMAEDCRVAKKMLEGAA
ncbi:MAG: bifunctional riboflavin kinase/FAD synthetase [Alphaproteobacteria bacterium]|nr:bifunctional riboflavin kinase/FAD synthetase [Alphaproteobacteria bacterium]